MTYPKKQYENISQKGQTFVAIIVLMLIALIIGITISSRFISGLHSIVRTDDAAKAMGILKAKDAVSPLIKSLNDPSSIVKKSVIRSLGQIGDKKALEYIELAQSDKNKVVAHMAETVLAQLTSKK